MRIDKNKLINLSEITLGVFLVSVAFYFFLSPSQLVVGGVMGLAIILDSMFGLPEVIMIYVFNITFLFVGLFFLGKTFFFKTVYGTILTPTIMAIFELFGLKNDLIYSQIAPGNQLFVVTLCASVLTGIGLGLVIRNGATTGGMDVPQRVISVKLHLPFSYVMYTIDGLVICVGFAQFGIEKGIFAVISLFLIGYLTDIFSVGGTSKRAFYIITDKEEEINKAILEKINRGATIVDVVGGYTKNKKKMIICILNKGQYAYLRAVVNEIDPTAFIYITKANEVIGEGFSKEESKQLKGDCQ